MAELTIMYDPVGGKFSESVMIARIVRLSKSDPDESVTWIHLDTGEILRADNSLKTLNARIDLASER